MVLLVCFDFFLRTCLLQVHQVSVSHCVSTNLRRGVQVFGNVKMNWIIFVLSIVTNSNYLRFIHLYSYFLPDNMWLAVASGLSVLSHFMEAVGVSDWFGCSGLLECVLGCSGLSRLLHSEVNLLRLRAWLTAWGFSGLSSFFWAAVASRDSLACSKHGLFI